ncbi:MAG: class I SAM-dependent methyltransferase [Kofleriaceae bacterium]|nr:class I SAM-dependent methyltransferase [Kofleriaceae bacterium]
MAVSALEYSIQVWSGPPSLSRSDGAMTMDRNAEVNFYNEHWRTHDFLNRSKMARAAAIMQAMSQLRKHAPRIIDLGCGTGWLTGILANFGPTTGVELSPEAVTRARELHPRATFECVDFRDWKVPEGQFDVVVSQEVLEHVEDQAAYIDIARRLLVTGGHLILTTPNRTTFDTLPPEMLEIWARQPIEIWLTGPELRALVKPRFRVLQESSLILGYGNSLVRRALGARKVRRWRPAAMLAESAGLGLHLFLVAEAR